MKNVPDPQRIQDTAIQMGVDPDYLEKDWYAVYVLRHLSMFSSQGNVTMVFSGGTSLSKGFGILKRFSEDLDFVLFFREPSGSKTSAQKKRSAFRKSLIAYIKQLGAPFSIVNNPEKASNEGKFFQVLISYGCTPSNESIRPHLQLEMTFIDAPPFVEECLMRPIVPDIAENGEGDELKVLCVSPAETAANKVSALVWRTISCDEGGEQDDPTFIRHLHDIAALKPYILEKKDLFLKCVSQALEKDQHDKKRNISPGLSIKDRVEKSIELLKSDDKYRIWYLNFVISMFYGPDKERILFDEAVSIFEEITRIFLSHDIAS